MQRRGLIPPPPPEISGQTLMVQYVSMLAEAQKAAQTNGIERLLGIVGNIAAAKPDILDLVDDEEAVREYN